MDEKRKQVNERDNGRKRISRYGRCELRSWVYRGPYSCSKSGRWPWRVWPYAYRDMQQTTVGVGAIGGGVADAHIELCIWRRYDD